VRKFYPIFFLLILLGCNSEQEERIVEKLNSTSLKAKISYAKGFSIEVFDGYKIITVSNSWVGDNNSVKYVLYRNEKPKEISGAIFIKTPITSIACMSLTQVAFIEKLGKEKSIIALSGCDYVSSSNIKNRVSTNLIKEIGEGQNINYEMLVEEKPNFIMGFGIDASSNNYINKLASLGLDVVLNAEYMETHPLGKAEWIKFIAAFYEEEAKADSIFKKIEKEYLELLKLTKNIKKRPTVFTGMPWNGSWYIPGAASFQAQLLKDAGAQYLWLDNDEKSSLIKSKEIIIDEAYDADYWLNQNSYSDIASIINYDDKFKGFKAVKQKNLYNNDNRINGAFGNDYWESGVASPQVILKDLIKIFHPQLIEHEIYYYRKLK
jgi:iron complex transport system substrate-binding protein